MKILIISGFLGAGKTTFIKELARRTGGDIAVMENEYGEVGIDGGLLQDGKINIWELTEGCICCSVKSDFATSVLTIANTVDPAWLVVEPTGVGMLSNVIRNLQKIEYERISLLAPLTVLDRNCYFSYRRKYGEIYEDQIRYASRIIFSKADLPSMEDLGKICGEVRDMNPTAELVTEDYRNMPEEWWREILRTPLAEEAGKTGPEAEQAAGQSTAQDAGPAEPEIRLYQESRLNNKTPEFENMGIREGQLDSASRLVLFLEELIRGAYGDICRAKGFLRTGENSVLRFDVVDRRYSITGAEGNEEVQCVFIGNGIRRNALRELLIPGYQLKKGEKTAIRIRLQR